MRHKSKPSCTGENESFSDLIIGCFFFKYIYLVYTVLNEKMIDRYGNRGAKFPTLFMKLNSREAFEELIKMFRNLKYSTGSEPGLAGKWIVPADENNPVYRPL